MAQLNSYGREIARPATLMIQPPLVLIPVLFLFLLLNGARTGNAHTRGILARGRRIYQGLSYFMKENASRSQTQHVKAIGAALVFYFCGELISSLYNLSLW